MVRTLSLQAWFYHWPIRAQRGVLLAGPGGLGNAEGLDFAMYTCWGEQGFIFVFRKHKQNESRKHSWPLLREKPGEWNMDFVKCAVVARNASESVQADWLFIVEQGSTHSAKFRNNSEFEKRKQEKEVELRRIFAALSFKVWARETLPLSVHSNGPCSVGWWISSRRLGILNKSKKWQVTWNIWHW